VASLSQGRTAAAQCGLFTHKSVPVIFEPPCIKFSSDVIMDLWKASVDSLVQKLPTCSVCMRMRPADA